MLHDVIKCELSKFLQKFKYDDIKNVMDYLEAVVIDYNVDPMNINEYLIYDVEVGEINNHSHLVEQQFRQQQAMDTESDSDMNNHYNNNNGNSNYLFQSNNNNNNKRKRLKPNKLTSEQQQRQRSSGIKAAAVEEEESEEEPQQQQQQYSSFTNGKSKVTVVAFNQNSRQSNNFHNNKFSSNVSLKVIPRSSNNNHFSDSMQRQQQIADISEQDLPDDVDEDVKDDVQVKNEDYDEQEEPPMNDTDDIYRGDDGAGSYTSERTNDSSNAFGNEFNDDYNNNNTYHHMSNNNNNNNNNNNHFIHQSSSTGSMSASIGTGNNLLRKGQIKLCAVCENKPAKGLFFGAFTCDYCRSFFSKNVLLKLECHGIKENCDVTGTAHRKCPKCRMDKCFRVGMNQFSSPRWMKSKKISLDLVTNLESLNNVNNNRIKNNNNHSIIASSCSNSDDDQQQMVDDTEVNYAGFRPGRPICAVCEKPLEAQQSASSGAACNKVCRACSIFFKRYYDENLYCTVGAQKCDITGDQRNKCNYCRFQKCLRVGLKINTLGRCAICNETATGLSHGLRTCYRCSKSCGNLMAYGNDQQQQQLQCKFGNTCSLENGKLVNCARCRLNKFKRLVALNSSSSSSNSSSSSSLKAN